jgi:MYXO-CTERM domain-containing protein
LLNNVGATRGSGETWTTVVFKVRETDESPALVTLFDSLGLVVQLGPNVGATGVTTISTAGFFSATDAGSGFFEVTVDISGYTQNSIDYFRIDPIGGPDASLNTFEVDYIRINDSAAVPEPSAALLGAIGGLALLRRRR